MHSLKSRLAVGAAIGTAATALAWTLGFVPFVQTVELKTYDLRVRALADPRRASRDIVIVSITDESVRKLEPIVGRWPWPRLVHGQLVDFLSRAPARVVAYDVLFTERDRRTFAVGESTWTGEESDGAFADAVARAGNVVVVGDVTVPDPLGAVRQPDAAALLDRSRVPAPDGFESRPGLVPPYAGLAAAAAGLGHNFMVLDADGPVRRTVPVVRIGSQGVPSLAVATALRSMRLAPSALRRDGAALVAGSTRAPLVEADVPEADGTRTRSWRQLIRFTGPGTAGDSAPVYPEYSFYDLFFSEQQIQAGETPFVDPARFRDKIVFVGTTAAGLHDVFTVPFAGAKMPGAQVHANVVDNLISGQFVSPAPGWASAGLALVCALAVGVLVMAVGVWWATLASLVVLAAAAAFAAWLFTDGRWIEVARPAMAVAFSLFGSTAYQYFVEGREKRLVKQVFSRFVSRDVFTQLMADPSRAALGGARREMSVLFSDIRGFTGFTERGRPDDVVGQLNEYFSAMVPVVFAHRGTVDKFVGDMVMALFGAPLDDPDHADHAVQAGLAMLAELEAINRRWAAEGRPTLAIGVGVNSGDMVAGNIGAESIMSYTVIGDAVNLGSRLESLTKQYGTAMIISEYTRSRLKRRYDVRSLGTVTVKGKSVPVEIFEVRPAVSAHPETKAPDEP